MGVGSVDICRNVGRALGEQPNLGENLSSAEETEARFLPCMPVWLLMKKVTEEGGREGNSKVQEG